MIHLSQAPPVSLANPVALDLQGYQVAQLLQGLLEILVLQVHHLDLSNLVVPGYRVYLTPHQCLGIQ